jgi:hypothetical protein
MGFNSRLLKTRADLEGEFKQRLAAKLDTAIEREGWKGQPPKMHARCGNCSIRSIVCRQVARSRARETTSTRPTMNGTTKASKRCPMRKS